MRSRRQKSETVRHIFCFGLAVLLFAAAPAAYLTASGMGDVDAVSSATTILAQPSGAYIVLINEGRHTDAGKLQTWKQFFSGEEIDFIFEDISCIVAGTDAAGWEIAESFQSRLPENQMKLRTEDATLLLSKIYYGEFDVALFSREAYEGYGAEIVTKRPRIMSIMAGEGWE
ncbi:MAG: hypothetical protein IJ600_10385 [Lachnospiraceae bacterium]|nr:hypothetical protein [Lachnospiraceae bacterium]